jgi:peptidoglycan/LPS O-acetylase OafA/YrhL
MKPVVDTRLSYRPDIDGLRAIAIMTVLLFHAFPEYFPGGFIGVDIFFVISGYLISAIIFNKLDGSAFNFLDFYIHRARRIFPALVVVMATVFIFGWICLFGDEFKQLGAHMAASAGFVENFLLYGEKGYFDVATELKPLMHLWSLAIEEQFYLFFPPLICLLWRWRGAVFATICVLAALSFVVSVVLTASDAAAAFFFPHSRAWELFAGAIVAHMKSFDFKGERRMAMVAPPRLAVRASRAISAAATLAMAVLVVVWDKAWPFPGVAALLPVGFALAAIVGGERLAMSGNLLASKPFVTIGLISYPLYLWHWPILSFLHILKGPDDTFAYRAGGALASIGMAWLVYRWAERPLRFGGRAKAKALGLCIAVFLLGALGGYTYFRDGFPFRYMDRVSSALALGSAKFDLSHVRSECGLSPSDAAQFASCLRDSRGEPSIALIGDSKAAALAPAIFAYPDPGRFWLFIGGSTKFISFVPLLSEDHAYRAHAAVARLGVSRLEAMDQIKVVVLSVAARTLFGLANDYSIDDLPKSRLYDAALDGLDRTVGRLIAANKKVVLTVDNPTLPPPRQCSSRATAFGPLNWLLSLQVASRCAVDMETFLDQSRQYRNLLAEIKRRHPDDVVIVDVTDMLCDEQRHVCEATKDGWNLYGVTDHVSGVAAARIAERLVPIAEGLARPRP